MSAACILVTGGSGFIGSNFIRFIYEKYPHDIIINLDALTYAGNPDNLADIEGAERLRKEKARYLFFKGDITDEKLVASVLLKHSVTHVVNFAAESHVDRSFFDVSDFLRTNVDGVRVLIDTLRQIHPLARFVHISTDEVYGTILDGDSKEESPIRPSNLYSASKAAGDILVQAYINTGLVSANIIRGSNNYGPFQYPEKLIPLAITNLIEKKPIPLHGSGEHVRSWLHVNDFCAAIDMVMRLAAPATIYNVSGEKFKNIEVLSMLADMLGVQLDAYVARVPDRPGADLRYSPDSQKLQNELGWKSKFNLASALKDVIDWYHARRDWWEAIKAKKEYLNHYAKQSKGSWY